MSKAGLGDAADVFPRRGTRDVERRAAVKLAPQALHSSVACPSVGHAAPPLRARIRCFAVHHMSHAQHNVVVLRLFMTSAHSVLRRRRSHLRSPPAQ